MIPKLPCCSGSECDFFFFFWLCGGFVAVCGLYLAVVCGLLIAVASLVLEHRLSGGWASVVVAHVLSCPAACGVFPDQGSNLCPLHWQANT